MPSKIGYYTIDGTYEPQHQTLLLLRAYPRTEIRAPCGTFDIGTPAKWGRLLNGQQHLDTSNTQCTDRKYTRFGVPSRGCFEKHRPWAVESLPTRTAF